MELQIDSSTRYACVGLSREGRTLVEIAWRSERNHSVELVPAINRAMDQAGASIADLGAVFVASGPGGFSALRVGMSTAKAIAHSSEIPLVTVGTLELETSTVQRLAPSRLRDHERRQNQALRRHSESRSRGPRDRTPGPGLVSPRSIRRYILLRRGRC